MQLYALDAQNKVIYAQHAMKQHDYFCIECAQIVRRRGGVHYQTHYYHLSSATTCSLSGKSMIHLQVQTHLQALLSEEDCLLEYRFPTINRIADAFWKPRNLVFEIQCSSINAEEVRSRIQDYHSLGLQVVWILHDRRFNQVRISAAEQYLQKFPYYFTNIDESGDGEIYDQFSLNLKGIRENILSPMPVDLRHPRWFSEEKTKKGLSDLPKFILHRLEKWPLCFSGDLLHRSLFESLDFHYQEYIEHAKQLEKHLQEGDERAESQFYYLLHHWIFRPYRLFFQMLLEKACR